MMKRTAFILSLILGLACASRGQVMMLFTADSLSYITSPLGVDSLFYWFAADQGVTDSLGGAIATNEGVGTWEDLGPGGWDVSQTTDTDRPVYKSTGGPGNKPCLQFDGSDDYLASAAHWWGSDDITIIVVMKFANATRDVSEYIVSKIETVSPANTRQWRLEGKESVNSYNLWFGVLKDGSSSNFVYYTDSPKSTAWKCIAFASNGSGTYYWYNDGSSVSPTETIVGTGDRTIYNASIKLGIGAVNVTGGSPSLFLQGSISEIIVYSKALTAAERGAIENYLNKKYDLYYLIIIGFPLAPIAGAKRRKLIPNDKKKAA